MRGPLLALLALAIAGCSGFPERSPGPPATGSPATSTPTATTSSAFPSPHPTEFRPAWRVGGVASWFDGANVANVTMPPGWAWASDGRSWLYATSAPAPHDDAAVARCGPMPPEGGAWVLVNVTSCNWERHPTVACDLPSVGSGPCEAAWSRAPPATNVYVPYWRAGPASFTWLGNGGPVRVTLPAGASFATDRHTYLYATNSLAPHEGAAADACLGDHGGYGPVIVLVEVEPCSIARHPGISCGGFPRGEDPCEPVTGPPP
jgi:hypothetical protein